MTDSNKIIRKKTKEVLVGKVKIGGNSPIVVQSMTDTDTVNISATVSQIILLAEAGSEIVRITVNNDQAAKSVSEIKSRIIDAGYDIPLVGDFHFIGHRLLKDNPLLIKSLDKLRINPGNVGRGSKHDENFYSFINIAKEYNKAVRIGVNAGSLDPDILSKRMDENSRLSKPKSSEEVENIALVESAISSLEAAKEIGLSENKIVISCKVSRLNQMVNVYRKLSNQCDSPLHLGLTEAGMGRKGIVSTTSALSILLYEGIGDTIRASLTPDINGDRSLEVKLCQDILQSIGLRKFRPSVTACPGCGRTTSSFFRELASEIENFLNIKRPEWEKIFPGSEELNVAVMGCVVNGPGESRAADVGISLPGSGESPRAPVYIDGKREKFLNDDIANQFINIVEQYVSNRWGN
tara:strand:+ start:11221 stop:12444 length:1224 start_codon:yes stop_codon:yes gene_type:complete